MKRRPATHNINTLNSHILFTKYIQIFMHVNMRVNVCYYKWSVYESEWTN